MSKKTTITVSRSDVKLIVQGLEMAARHLRMDAAGRDAAHLAAKGPFPQMNDGLRSLADGALALRDRLRDLCEFGDEEWVTFEVGQNEKGQ